jgi:hypothetical protein
MLELCRRLPLAGARSRPAMLALAVAACRRPRSMKRVPVVSDRRLLKASTGSPPATPRSPSHPSGGEEDAPSPSLRWSFVLAVAFIAASAIPVAAATLDLSAFPAARAVAPDAPVHRIKAPDLASEAELIRFDPELLPALLRVQPGERVRISGWPVGVGSRKDVLITRHEIYAPGARVLRLDAGGMRELPRSRLVFFWGTEADDPESGIFISVDPAGGLVESLTQSAAGRSQLRPLEPGKGGLHLVATPEAFLAGVSPGKKPSWHCAEETLVPLLPAPAAAGAESQTRRAPRDPGAVIASGGFNLATIAVDTDHEFMATKFNNDTTQATNYIASLFAATNVMYERDAQVQLLVGDTILRTSAAADPYTVNPNSDANADELNEFSSYWSTNYGSVTRSLAAMLSGKQPSSNSASGIAWVGGLCSSSNGYSFSQLFLIDYLTGDVEIFGHEVGHNFGSEHTHCYNPPIDHCFAQEAGCYSGPTSCPAVTTINGVTGVTGTMMSYCNFLGNCSVALVFHPRVVSVLQSNVATALGVCMTGGSLPTPAVTGISPNHGSVAGGTPVVISGSHFQSGDTVSIGGVTATNVVVSGPGTITAVTGAHATGKVDVVVTAGPGGASSTLASSYFYAPAPATSRFYTVAPCRVIDTRNANGPLGGPSLAGGQTRNFLIPGACGIPGSAVAVSANITVIGGSGGGFLSVYPGNALPLGTSSLNFAAGRVVANNAVLMLATDGTGTVAVQNGAATGTQLLLDVNGYFQ